MTQLEDFALRAQTTGMRVTALGTEQGLWAMGPRSGANQET